MSLFLKKKLVNSLYIFIKRYLYYTKDIYIYRQTKPNKIKNIPTGRVLGWI